MSVDIPKILTVVSHCDISNPKLCVRFGKLRNLVANAISDSVKERNEDLSSVSIRSAIGSDSKSKSKSNDKTRTKKTSRSKMSKMSKKSNKSKAKSKKNSKSKKKSKKESK